jgi:transposase-like protein
MAIEKMYAEKEDPFEIIENTEKQMQELRQVQEDAYEKMQKITIEGNLQERQKAQNALNLKKELEKRQKNNMKILINKFKMFPALFKKYQKDAKNNGWDIKKAVEWADELTIKLRKENDHTEIKFNLVNKLAEKLKKGFPSPATPNPSQKNGSKN